MTIRNIDDAIKKRLCVRAAISRTRSMSASARWAVSRCLAKAAVKGVD